MKSEVILAAALTALPGCGGGAAPAEAARAATPAEAIRQRTVQRFELADFVKPLMEEDFGIDPYLAPLIYLEAPHDAPLGALVVDGSGGLRVDPARPTVYFEDALFEVDGQEVRRVSFVWFRALESPRAQGVRMTCDANGFPWLTEVLVDASGLDLVYVITSREGDAPRDEGTLVAGVIGSAPAPMGPYVYQAAGSNDLTTVHCRCSPTQADEIRAMVEYELVPLAALEGTWPRADDPGFGGK